MTATHTAASGLRRVLRLAVGTAALGAFCVGVPWLLWQAAGGQPLPAPGPGGWAEVWAELKVGQLPETAVTAAVVVVGWVVWTYLAVIVLDEIRVAWRDRHQSADRLGRLNEISSFRRLVARGVGWLLAGHTMAAGFLITPSAGVFDARPPVAAMDTDPGSTGWIDVIGETQSAPAALAFDPHGYLDLAADPQPQAVASGLATTDVVERVIAPGDNLWTIAEELTGDGFNYRAIWAATDLNAQDPPVDPTNPDLIFPGNVVRIPTSLITPGTEIAAPIDNAALASAQPGPAPDVAGPTDTPATSAAAVPAPVSTAPAPVVDDAADGGDPAVSLPGRPTDNAAAGAPVGKEQEVAPGPGPSEEPSSDVPAALIPALGLGGAGGAMLLAGVARRRRRAMAASGRGQRPPRQHRAAARTSQRLQADLPAELWAPDDLVAAWNSLHPVDPGAR